MTRYPDKTSGLGLLKCFCIVRFFKSPVDSVDLFTVSITGRPVIAVLSDFMARTYLKEILTNDK